MSDVIRDAIEQSMSDVAVFQKYGGYMTREQKDEVIDWARSLYQDGWNNSKKIFQKLGDNKKL